MKLRSNKTEMIRARVDASLKRDVGQIATFQGLDESDITRIALMRLVQEFKQPATIAKNLLACA